MPVNTGKFAYRAARVPKPPVGVQPPVDPSEGLPTVPQAPVITALQLWTPTADHHRTERSDKVAALNLK